jgi:hypothetical protein
MRARSNSSAGGSLFPGEPIIEADGSVPWSELDRRPFMFRHRLQPDALFSIPRLTEIAIAATARADWDRFLFSPGTTDGAGIRPSSIGANLREALSDLERRRSWVKISSLHELAPAYGEVLAHIIRDLERQAKQPLRQMMTFSGLTVFIASPRMMTPYHFDHESNFLFQLAGTKDDHLFDPGDRFILTEQEIEQFYRGDQQAGRYRPELAGKSVCHHLQPGWAVHHPPLAPHLVHNGDEISVSVSVYYSLAPADARAHVYQANYVLRRMGLRPRAPGSSRLGDLIKSTSLRAMSNRSPRTREERLFSGIERVKRLFSAGGLAPPERVR